VSSTAGLTTTDKPGTALRKLDIQSLIEQAVANNAGVDVLERIFTLAKDVRAEQAKEAWNRAMVEFQKQCPKILKTKKGEVAGRFEYKFAPLDEVLAAIQPVMTDLDLSVSWRHRTDSGKVTANCRISHGLGHYEESGEIAMPVGEDRSGATAAQKVGIALTYARRYTLLSIVGIAPEDDPDAQGTDAAPAPQQRPESPGARLGRETAESGVQQAGGSRINEAQHKRLWAIAYKAGEAAGLSKQEVADRVATVCESMGFSTSKVVTVDRYKDICEELEIPF
jgi:ERF superfamily